MVEARQGGFLNSISTGTEPSEDDPLVRYRIHEAVSPDKKWTLYVFADRLEFEAADGRLREVAWKQRHGRLETQERALFMRRLVVLTAGKQRVLFRLDPDAFAAVKAWYGPLTVDDVKIGLKRRLSWVIPIGFLFVLAAVPIGGMAFEPVSFGLGLGLILTGALSKLWPHRVFFALDSLWFCTLAANSIVILTDGWDWLRLGFLLLQLHLAWRGIQEFHRFAPNQMALARDAERESP